MPDQPAGDNPVPNIQTTDQPQTPTPTEPTPTFMDTGSMAPPPAPAPNTPPGTTEEVPPPPTPAGETPGGPPVVTTAAPPKKKKVKARVIATIIGILFLVGGVTAGVFLVQQQQELREEAAEGEWPVPVTSYYKVCSDGKCVLEGTCPQGAKCADVCQSDGDCGPTGVLPFKTPTPPSGEGGCGTSCMLCECPQGCAIFKDCVSDGTHHCEGVPGTHCTGSFPCKGPECRSNCKIVSCSTTPSACGQLDLLDSKGAFCGIKGAYCTNGTNPCDGGGGGQTPPPTATASCADVKAYNTSWVAMSAADLNNLDIGDRVNFCVRGSTSSGSFDKGRFRVNLDDAIDLNWQETTTRRPGSTNEFCLNYTLDTVGNFVVDGQIHHSALNKWY